MIIQNIILPLLAAFTFANCNSSQESSANGPSDTQKVAVNEVMQTIQLPSDSSYVNGVTDKNRGDKKGMMSLKGAVPANIPHPYIYLYETEGRFYYVIDSAKIENGRFDFGTKEYSRGFYKFKIEDENNMATFIMNPDESAVELHFSAPRLEPSMRVVVSNENKGWKAYYTTENQLNNKIRGLRMQRGKAADKTQFDTMIEQAEQDLLTAKHETIRAYPETYLAKILTYRQMPFHDDLGKFWEDVDFTDESIIRSTMVTLRMNEFMRTHSDGTDSGFLKCIDLTKAKAEVNPRVLEFVLFTMLDGFHQSDKENICQYILDNYIFDEDCGAELTDVIRQRAEGIINLQIGKTPPDFTIETDKGGTLNMRETAAANNYTLLMFWSSWCHKCEQEIPVLKGVYSEFHPQGFEVIGISVDTDRNAWLGAIEKKGAKWLNVSQLNSWKSPVAQDYRVTQTPALFLVNSTGEIVLKPKRIYEVLHFLKANLK